MSRVKWGMAVVLVLLATACGGSSDEPNASEKTTPVAETTPSPSSPVSYGSVADLRDAAVEAGYVCKNWKQANEVTLAAESATCDGESVLTTYASDGDLQQQLDTEKSTTDMLTDAGIETTPILVGPNWLLKAPQAPDLREALGGILIGAKS